MKEYELIIKGIKIYQKGLWQDGELVISRGIIKRIILSGVEKIDAEEVLDFSGAYASPGWVDLHTHLLPLRYGGIGTHSEKIGIKTGVTALLDVGTVGAGNFELFYEKVIQRSATPVFSFLNIKKSGIRFWQIPAKPNEDDLDKMEAMVKKYPNYIKGIKITASREHMLKSDPLYYMRKAHEAGDHLKLPVMVHIGLTPPSLKELLPLMKKGDILTHCFRNGDHTILDPWGKIRAEVLEAKARGVRFDIGHGVRSFSFPVAEKALEQGFDDFTISSDLYMLSTPYRAKSFANVLSKFLALGMKLEDVCRLASTKPAEVLGLEREIAEGKPATLTIFKIEQGSFRFQDCWGISRVGQKRIIPLSVMLEGKIYQV